MRKQQWVLANDDQVLGCSGTGHFGLVPRGHEDTVYFTTNLCANGGITSLFNMGHAELARTVTPRKIKTEYARSALRVATAK